MKENVTDTDERVIEIEIERLRDFRNHPFKVLGDIEMIELKQSIEKYGILNPIIVRPLPEGVYEIISGHRRKFAAEKIGYRKVPVIIRYMKDDDAIISMVDSNLQREHITPSEKAHAYKMKYEVIKRKSGRKKPGQVDHEIYGKRSLDVISEDNGDSPKQVQRYIKLTNLIPELLQKLDDEEISFTPAVELSYLSKSEQRDVIEAMDYSQAVPSLSQAMRMKKMSAEGSLNIEKMEEILSETKKSETNRVIFKNEQLYRFFPTNYTADQMKREIIEILKNWATDYIKEGGR